MTSSSHKRRLYDHCAGYTHPARIVERMGAAVLAGYNAPEARLDPRAQAGLVEWLHAHA